MLYRRKHEPVEILSAYLSVLGKAKRKMPPPKEAFSGIVKRRVVSVQSRILTILHMLYRQKTIGYKNLFAQSEDRRKWLRPFGGAGAGKTKRIVVDENGQIAFGENRTPAPVFAQNEQEEGQ